MRTRGDDRSRGSLPVPSHVRDTVYRFTFAMTGDEHRAAEMTADALCRELRSGTGIDGTDRTVARLLRYSMRQVARKERHAGRAGRTHPLAGARFEVGADPSSLSPMFARESTHALLRDALAGLPVPRRCVLVTCDVLGLPDPQVALLLRCSETAVPERLERARTDFQALLDHVAGRIV